MEKEFERILLANFKPTMVPDDEKSSHSSSDELSTGEDRGAAASIVRAEVQTWTRFV